MNAVRKLSPTQRYAIRWLANNGGLEVPNMNLDGRSSDWPTVATLRALLKRDLVTFTQGRNHWRVDLSEAGKALDALSSPSSPR
jgi:hypothetical protein